MGSDLQVFVTVNEVRVIGGEESGIVDSPSNPEVKGILGVIESNGGQVDGEAEVAEGINREHSFLRHFESTVFGVCDLELKVLEGIDMESEFKFFDDWAFFFNIVIIRAGVCEGEGNWWRILLGMSYFVVGSAWGEEEKDGEEDKMSDGFVHVADE